ncbi:MAG TPA: carboxylesterase/lipase family protein [Terracidiphilus sp.]|nr:carboxylesterase/lipase family protein [Terracidiphilus sp.]
MRLRLLVVCFAALPCFLLAFSAAASADPLTVKTAQGKVHGKTINDGKVRAFLGLPYAAPPVGDLRWKAPQPPASWKKTRNATNFGHHCVQGRVFDDMVFQDAGESEDCLYLNVYAPAKIRGHKKLPVMFWIHGGGFSGGSADEPRHNGDFLPLKGVVLVTINYRLGVFGFLTLADLATEAEGSTGNYGMLDQVAALQWVHDNIAGFGGDPDNVTIFGESAGSFAVSALMASPTTRGLFAKAIGESGGALNTGALVDNDLKAIETRNLTWMTTLGISSLPDFRKMPAETLLEDSHQHGAPRFGIVVDGDFLTEPVADVYADGSQAHVPLLAGWNHDEISGLANGMTVAKWKEFAQTTYGDNADQFLALYPGNTDEEAQRSAIDYGSDSFIAYSTWQWIEAHVKTGNAPVYRYRFDLAATPSKFHPGTFAFHSDDIEYVFGTLDTRPGFNVSPDDRKLSDEIMDYWTNFAKTGDPNGGNLPQWPRYDKTGKIIFLDKDITSGEPTTTARYQFMMKVKPLRNPLGRP